MTLHFVSTTLTCLVCIELKRKREETTNLVVSRSLFFKIFLFKVFSLFSRFFRFFTRFWNTFVQTSHFFYILLFTYVYYLHRIVIPSRLSIISSADPMFIDRSKWTPTAFRGTFIFLFGFFPLRPVTKRTAMGFFYSVHFFSIYTFTIRPSVLTSARNEWIYGWDRRTPDWLVR